MTLMQIQYGGNFIYKGEEWTLLDINYETGCVLCVNAQGNALWLELGTEIETTCEV